MKRRISVSLVIFLFPVITFACDICGCGVGNSYIGLLPDFNKTIMGFRYRFNSLRTHIGAGGAISYLTTDETYRTIEVWGGWNIGKKFRLMTSIPFNFNEKVNQGDVNRKKGLGDISVSGYYELFNKKQSVLTSKLLVQSLWIGGGFKLPTGEYTSADKSEDADNSNLFQLGTGSVDFTANLMYDIRLQDAGLNINSSYKLNSANKYDYRYGNKFSLSAQAYYKFRLAKKISIAPNVGTQYETANKDKDGASLSDGSGGRILLATTGVETVMGKIIIGGNYQLPLHQNLANGFVKAGDRFMLHVSFLF
ncbi:MAG: transporter [Chitinophagaceae bacterium]|nr:transporter [Chitinophagaceae bacterium]